MQSLWFYFRRLINLHAYQELGESSRKTAQCLHEKCHVIALTIPSGWYAKSGIPCRVHTCRNWSIAPTIHKLQQDWLWLSKKPSLCKVLTRTIHWVAVYMRLCDQLDWLMRIWWDRVDFHHHCFLLLELA